MPGWHQGSARGRKPIHQEKYWAVTTRLKVTKAMVVTSRHQGRSRWVTIPARKVDSAWTAESGQRRADSFGSSG